MTSVDLRESRYDRQERISWWDQSRLAAAHVLVVGAGALGNEIVKNLALVGVGHVDVVDMDHIEHSNLARCALFRESDEGRPKAEALVDAASSINPDVRLRAFVGRVQDLGSAWLRQYDVVIAGLDSREARLWVNATCRRLGLHWVDGAIEGLQGLVRVFGPEGPCYECTLGEADMAALSHRRSCALLSPEEIAGGHTPTNATTASVVAGLEVQEAIKLIVGRHDLLALEGRVWRLEGETMMTSVMEYIEDPDCLAHDRITDWIDAPESFDTLAEVVDSLEQRMDAKVLAIYFSDDVITVESCTGCGAGAFVIGLRPLLDRGVGLCDSCGDERPMASRTALDPTDALTALPWQQWQWPKQEAVAIATPQGTVHTILGGSDGV